MILLVQVRDLNDCEVYDVSNIVKRYYSLSERH